MPKKAKSKKAKSKAKPKAVNKRGKTAVLERYGSFAPTAQDKRRREQIDWLEENFVNAVIVFGTDIVQRKLCQLKGINFDEYDDPNN
jgi:hypothetical protein